MAYGLISADLRGYPTSEELKPEEFLTKLSSPGTFKVWPGSGGAATRVEFFFLDSKEGLGHSEDDLQKLLQGVADWLAKQDADLLEEAKDSFEPLVLWINLYVYKDDKPVPQCRLPSDLVLQCGRLSIELRLYVTLTTKPEPSAKKKPKRPATAGSKEVLAGFNAFASSGDEYQDLEQLEELVEQWKKLPKEEQAKAVPGMFGVFERHPDSGDFGNPGPLVHALETAPSCEKELLASLKRQPSYYGLWMLNRNLNSDLPEKRRTQFLGLLRAVAENESLSEIVRDTAQEYLEYQEEEEDEEE